jgi:hypothetical protein
LTFVVSIYILGNRGSLKIMGDKQCMTCWHVIDWMYKLYIIWNLMIILFLTCPFSRMRFLLVWLYVMRYSIPVATHGHSTIHMEKGTASFQLGTGLFLMVLQVVAYNLFSAQCPHAYVIYFTSKHRLYSQNTWIHGHNIEWYMSKFS